MDFMNFMYEDITHSLILVLIFGTFSWADWVLANTFAVNWSPALKWRLLAKWLKYQQGWLTAIILIKALVWVVMEYIKPWVQGHDS